MWPSLWRRYDLEKPMRGGRLFRWPDGGTLDGMPRRKTTVYLDPGVVTALRALAASRGWSVSALAEKALRAFLAGDGSDGARSGLRSLMATVAARDLLGDEEAMAVAVDEAHAVREARHARRPR
jgi:hypothetical protein